MKRHSARRVRSRGSAIIEASLSILVVILMVIGCIDVGQVMMRYQGLSERVRAGCRYAVTAPDDTAGIRNVVVYGTPTPAAPSGTGLLALKPEMVTVEREDFGTEAADRVTVAVENYPLILFTPGISGVYQVKPIRQSMTVEEAP